MLKIDTTPQDNARNIWALLCPTLAAFLLVLSSPAIAALAQEEDDENKTPKPEKVNLVTRDGVLLTSTFYPGTNKKKTVPVILIHGWGGVGGTFDGLASVLQEDYGHAVMVPDMRGHGRSTMRKFPNGAEQEIDPNRMRRADLEGMYKFDLEAVKKFLMKQNNAGELNIELLCVVGSGMGAIVAASWTAQDWSWPSIGNIKQGQDVKAMVMLSPVQSFKGLSLQRALQNPNVRRLSTMVIVGMKESRARTDARRVRTYLERFHPPVPKDPEEVKKNKDFFFVELNTSLQGTKLLTQRALKVDAMLAKFIELRLVNKQDNLPWTDRKSPLGG